MKLSDSQWPRVTDSGISGKKNLISGELTGHSPILSFIVHKSSPFKIISNPNLWFQAPETTSRVFQTTIKWQQSECHPLLFNNYTIFNNKISKIWKVREVSQTTRGLLIRELLLRPPAPSQLNQPTPIFYPSMITCKLLTNRFYFFRFSRPKMFLASSSLLYVNHTEYE